MKTVRRMPAKGKMNSDAYAGFLKLWLSPGSSVSLTPEVRAYLEHANEREPLAEATRRAIGSTRDQAA